jgi:hypothetical protein
VGSSRKCSGSKRRGGRAGVGAGMPAVCMAATGGVGADVAEPT